MGGEHERVAATIEEVIDALERVLAGRLSREDAIAWAHGTTGAGANSPFGTWPRDHLATFALLHCSEPMRAKRTCRARAHLTYPLEEVAAVLGLGADAITWRRPL